MVVCAHCFVLVHIHDILLSKLGLIRRLCFFIAVQIAHVVERNHNPFIYPYNAGYPS